MLPYFQKKENKEKLDNEVLSWIGAKYRHMGQNKFGVDCTKFIGLVFVNLGILSDIDREKYYSRDWHLTSTEEKVLDSFDENVENYIVEGFSVEREEYIHQELIPGDVILMSICRTGLTNHSGIYLGDNKFVHAVNFKGVCISQLLAIKKNITYFGRVFSWE